jgi:hypothetical protein
MTSFSQKIDYRIMLSPTSSILSLSALTIPKAELVSTGHSTKVARLSPQEHFARLADKPSFPFIVTGVRNVLANLRCVGYSKAMCKQFGQPPGTLATVAEEVLSDGRPYHCLYYRDGKFHIEELSSIELSAENQWVISGTPVLWNCSEDELHERMITDAADHSHVWQLPRGNHPLATNDTREHWKQLQEIFTSHLKSDRKIAAEALSAKAKEHQLLREKNYLHSVWGVTEGGELVIVIAHGRLEDVGRKAEEWGAVRAICVENSGSCGLYVVKSDASWKLQVCAPNFRPQGTAFVFFGLQDLNYGVIA